MPTPFHALIELLGDALALPVAERDALLILRCGSDTALLAEARDLLALAERGSLVDVTAVGQGQVRRAATHLAVPMTHPVRIGPYEVLEVLGEGGMGVVYGARQETPIRRDVAVKVMRTGLATPRAMARFELERQTLARLDHPGIAQVYDAGATHEGLPYLAMEWVHGSPITHYCHVHALGLVDRLKLFRQVCLAVHHAHQKAVIHRDLKPANILVSEVDGVALPKVIDFGIARVEDEAGTALTAQGSRIGTLEYMSPEQATPTGAAVDVRTDVYSLGVVLYELLTGSLPFASDQLRHATPTEMQRLLQEVDPPPPTSRSREGGAPPLHAMGRDVDWVVMTALQKDPARRYQSAEALALDVGRLERSEPVGVAPPGWRYRAGRFVRRHRPAVIGAVAVSATLLAGTIASTIGFVRARDARVLSDTEARKATAVTEFLTTMFASVEPDRALGNVVTVRGVLDAAAARLDSVSSATSDPEVDATIRFTLANSYRELGEYAKAISLFDRALATWRNLLPESDERIARSLHGIGNSHWRLGNLEDALHYAEQVLALRERTVGRRDARYSEAVEVLGSAHADLGHHELADSLYRVAVGIDSAVLVGTARSQLGTSLNNLATGLMDMQRYDEAAKVLRQSLQNRLEHLDPNDPRIAVTLGNLGSALMRMGSIDAALDTLQRAEALATRVLGVNHVQAINISFTLGLARHRAGQLDSAFTRLTQVRTTRAAVTGDDSWPVGEADLALGAVVVSRGDTTRGVAQMAAGWRRVVGALGTDHPRARRGAAAIADIVERHRGPAAASTWRQRTVTGS